MKPKTLYLLLCVAGLALPYWQFVPWVAQHGLNLRLFVQQLFANRIGGFFGMDVLVSALVLIIFMSVERARVKLRRGRWLPALALLSVGVSLALPLYLYLRELSLEHSGGGIRTATA
jgi:putative effector of murein hydrolase